MEEQNQRRVKFISTHPDSYVSLYTLFSYMSLLDPQVLETTFNGLSERLRNMEDVKGITRYIAISKRTAIGQPAINFTQNNTEGIPVSLSSLKGKYVLIDFWASWCGPCRKESPHLVKAYNKFKSRNFEIIAISLDDNKEKWLKAIKDDGLSWIHVSDLKQSKNAVGNAVGMEYGIRHIPTNLLLNPNGIIIAKNLRGEALEKKLDEILD
jgi:peroxiredoxin